MMKKLIPSFSVGLLFLALVGCGQTSSVSPSPAPSSTTAEESSQTPSTPGSSSSVDSSTTPSSLPDSSTSSGGNSSSSYEEPDIRPIYEGGTASGRLIDINANAYCRAEFSYDCRFTTSLQDKSITFKTSDPNVITVAEEESADGQFTLLTHASGNAVLEIYNSDEMIVYRRVVRVRPAIEVEDLEDYLFSIDSFVSIYDGMMMAHYEMSFTSVSSGEIPATGVLRGYDEVDASAQYQFNYVYDSYLADTDFYYFSIETTSSTTATELSGFTLSTTGDMLMVYYDSGDGDSLLTMLVPEELLSLHENL